MENILSKIKSQKKITHILNPHKHWIILLWVFGCIACCLIIFSLYLLFQIKNEQIFQVSPTVIEDQTLVKDKLLKSVSDSYTTKAVKEESVKTAPLKYLDPSL